MTRSPSYEELQKRLFYTRFVVGRGEHRQSFNGAFVVYFTYTGNIKSSRSWMVPGTENMFESLEG